MKLPQSFYSSGINVLITCNAAILTMHFKNKTKCWVYSKAKLLPKKYVKQHKYVMVMIFFL